MSTVFKSAILVALLVLFAGRPASAANVFFVDPAVDRAGDGSKLRPWKTLAEVVDGGAIRKVKPGDLVLLRSGYHGAVTLSGENSDFITIAADRGQEPRLSRLDLSSGAKWRIRGLTVSSSFGDKPYEGSMITFGDGGPSRDLVIEDCFVYTEADSSGWSAAQWIKANDGIYMGRYGKQLVLRNNYILNTRFGISLAAEESLCEGNVVSNFSADGIRITRDGLTVRYNVVKNVYVDDAAGDKNHDDGMQVFLFNKGTGTVRRATVVGNIIINREDDNQKFTNTLQGLGFFDGPLVDFVVTDNVILVEMWHGVTLTGAQNSRIERNVCFSRWKSRLRPWVELSGKSEGNTVRDNYACSYKIEPQDTVAANNRNCNAQIFEQALARAHQTICEKFGKYHPVAGYARLGTAKGKNSEVDEAKSLDAKGPATTNAKPAPRNNIH